MRSLSVVLVVGFAVLVSACSGGGGAGDGSSGSSGDGSSGSSGTSGSSGASGSSGETGSSGASGSSGTSGASSSSGEIAPTHQDGVKNGDETDIDCGGPTAPACGDGATCAATTDCTSLVCDATRCLAPSSTDGVKNGTETDVDCGGATAPRCEPTFVCAVPSDCAQGVCTANVCAAPAYDDEVKNGDETGIDCGGGAPDACPPGQGCAEPTDCTQRVCVNQSCAEPTALDGVKNGDETDIDCGGTSGVKCAFGLTCALGTDCAEKVCVATKCAAPTFIDNEQNGTETDVDCGGPAATAAQRCATGKACVNGQGARDCTSLVCTNSLCQAPTFTDGVKNGTETDVDCGGAGATPAQRCDTNQTCGGGTDCKNKICTATKCAAPTFADGQQNGTESDIDCGGAAATPRQRCKLGKACVVDATDCRSGGCLGNVCVPHSCAVGAGNGIDTCGLGGAGGRGAAAWESCCAAANVSVPQEANASIPLGKYPVTSGRMRQFLEAVGYDVRGFVRDARAANLMPNIPAVTGRTNSADKLVLEQDWDMYLPVSFAGQAQGELSSYHQGGNAGSAYAGIYSSVQNHLGGAIFRDNSQTTTGCYPGSGTHAFRFSNNEDGTPGYDQATYDTKAMNCQTYLTAQAFCVWDGGRLGTIAEWIAAIGPGARPWSAVDARAPRVIGSSSYFGCRFPQVGDNDINAGCPGNAADTIEFADYQFSYQYPPSLNNNDYIVFVSAPGRTRGRGPSGHSDLLGLHFEITSDVTYNADPFAARHRWTNPGSWEVHGYSKTLDGWGATMLLNKYGKLGFRCAYPELP